MSSPAKPKHGRILVIEDDWDILEVLKLMLEYEGHQVVAAKDGKVALQQLAGKPFDVVVMDVSMPEVSGIDVARHLRSDPKTAGVDIVFHTGLDEHWVHERFADYDLFLTKAKDVDLLVESIARLIAEPKAERAKRATLDAQTYSAEEAMLAQRALRESMSLGPEVFSTAALVGMLGDEIEQLRRVGTSDAEIAALISAATGREFSAASLSRHHDSAEAKRRR
ncbi:MAG: response regulator [Pseudomonadota bacterium]|nr:response regulator [Pseudomonadota bacterium]